MRSSGYPCWCAGGYLAARRPPPSRLTARAGSGTYSYYGHVTRDRGFVALQYWFLYAMNDWRSTFGGVNDHEADWEQVTVFLPDPPGLESLAARPAWVAFSSHDEVGDDLRRRQDDPDIERRDTHPVVFAGAGSHSGAYLPGDYLITFEPPVLRRVFAAVRGSTGCSCRDPRTQGTSSASPSSITTGGTARA